MNGTLALLVALTCYGNEYLSADKSTHRLDFNNSTLIYCNTLQFDADESPSQKKIVANDAMEWFAFLKLGGCKKLEIHFSHSSDQSQLKDHESAGFVGGGGTWTLEAVYNNYSNYWNFEETVSKPDAKDDRIWAYALKIIQSNQPISTSAITIKDAKENLSNVLSDISTFASNSKVDYWAGVFNKAKENLNSSKPVIEYYKDCVLNDRLSLPKQQLLFSAANADVFGGMGSWNDISLNTKEEIKIYHDLSAKLYAIINQSIIAAINEDE
jgi:hypothetical protein